MPGGLAGPGRALGGFLVHNRYPARLFMGDAGSNFLGFLLGTLTVVGTFTRPTAGLFALRRAHSAAGDGGPALRHDVGDPDPDQRRAEPVRGRSPPFFAPTGRPRLDAAAGGPDDLSGDPRGRARRLAAPSTRGWTGRGRAWSSRRRSACSGWWPSSKSPRTGRSVAMSRRNPRTRPTSTADDPPGRSTRSDEASPPDPRSPSRRGRDLRQARRVPPPRRARPGRDAVRRRAYFPSEDADTGSGLIWVFAILATSAWRSPRPSSPGRSGSAGRGPTRR